MSQLWFQTTWLAVLLCCVTAQAADTRITFTKQATQPGQQLEHRSLVHTVCRQTYEQSNQLISSTDREVRTKQVRNITMQSLTPPIAQVTFAVAHLQVGKNRWLARKQPQPVENKTYRVARVDGQLTITDAGGHTPPADEARIVESAMNWVGRPNELAEFLHGRTIAINQRLDLPPTVAARIFGGSVGLKKIEQASLTLVDERKIDGHTCGRFRISVQGVASDDHPEPLEIEGTITVDATNGRTMAAEIASDINMSEQRGPAGATFTVRNQGRVRISLQARSD